MANWHTLAGDDDGNSVRVCFHIPIPAAGNNRAGVQWRTALANSGLSGTIMVEGVGAGMITTAEKAQITAGEVYETVRLVHTNPGETNAQLVARLNALHTSLTTSEQARLQRLLTYFGGTG